VGQAHTLTQAQIDVIIAPLPERDKADLTKSPPQWLSWTDRLRGLYASLPEAKRRDMQAKGRCEVKLADLNESQAKVIKDLVAQDPDKNIREMLEQWAGKPPDLTKVTFLFVRSGSNVVFGFGVKGIRFTPAPIGILPGK
jgi:hypothetical protein